MNKNKEELDSLDSFVKYCKDYPDQRFFQALRNWIQLNVSGKWNWLMVYDGKNYEDTFYWE
jgi:hypothetical protein